MTEQPFTVIPAVDLLGGRVVRLRQGRYDAVTVYSTDPVSVAVSFERKGAQWLHIVDLDGARTGRPTQIGVISQICSSVNCPVQVGGGLRDLSSIQAVFQAGASRVVLGTRAVTDPVFASEAVRSFGPDRIAAAIDVRDGKVAVKGWTAQSALSPVDVCLKLMGQGIGLFVYTDIKRDGTLSSPNLEAIEELCRAVPAPIIVSGGITNVDDVRRLAQMRRLGLAGCLIGKALYVGSLDLEEALAAARSAP